MVQSRLSHDTIVEVVEVDRRQKFHAFRRGLASLHFRQVSHTCGPQIITFRGIVRGVNRGYLGMEVIVRRLAIIET